jgi:hypothetical protein
MTDKPFKFSGTLIRAGNNTKTIKGDKASQYVTAIMYLAPADLSGVGNVCPMAGMAGCKAGCLNLAGMGIYNSVQQARINKTKRFFADQDKFMNDLAKDVMKFQTKCHKEGRLPAVRLNGTSDIQFERIRVNNYKNIMDMFPLVQFYDYTKIAKRVYGELPSNYHLTLSHSEASSAYANITAIAHDDIGASVAVVVRTKEQAQALIDMGTMPNYGRYPNASIVSGDITDLRFLDPIGSVIVLYAKGKAKKDTSGFVVNLINLFPETHKEKVAA